MILHNKKNFIGDSIENLLKVCAAIQDMHYPPIIHPLEVKNEQNLIEIILSEFKKGEYVKSVQTGDFNYCAFVFGDMVVFGVCNDEWKYDIDRSYFLNDEESARFISDYKKQKLDIKINMAYELLSELDIEDDPRYSKRQFISYVLNNSSLIKEVSKEILNDTKTLYTYSFDDQLLTVAKNGRLIIYDENFDIRYNKNIVSIGNSNLKKEAAKEFVKILDMYENITEADFKEFVEILMSGVREAKEGVDEDLKPKPIYKLCDLLKINPSISRLNETINRKLESAELISQRTVDHTVTVRCTYKIGDVYFRINRTSPLADKDGELLLDSLEFLTIKKRVIEVQYFEEDELPDMKKVVQLFNGLEYINLDLFNKD